ncbi:uncharacterized protein AMSG_09502 [Thecamonas trahens ATCC 50062]|uniref:Uncharacterized protein n=1 Tax=Thecamonas trahens ATCC 50062 TaxID=461836 RepID=A0A0L0DQS0_THETB|nr:hypothetical protein AMSG_09502 [Thecamonas trahens ATCC 50062]KNC53783.1 hypothetical protein AMSG_09502 [Thecamonas trahens ATCC 50062]|eukprot:XP_013754345.1 hypothetical protein AMSG_09502 [Thecamonas trahens ATCC 50062]
MSRSSSISSHTRLNVSQSLAELPTQSSLVLDDSANDCDVSELDAENGVSASFSDFDGSLSASRDDSSIDYARRSLLRDSPRSMSRASDSSLPVQGAMRKRAIESRLERGYLQDQVVFVLVVIVIIIDVIVLYAVVAVIITVLSEGLGVNQKNQAASIDAL